MSENTSIYTTVFIGNLPWGTTNDDLVALFKPYGRVHAAKVVIDQPSGRSRGFGFVDMPADDAEAAILALHGKHFQGRELQVNIARPKPNRFTSS